MRSLDLFSGYGGVTLALRDLVKPIAYVEIEEYAQKIIAYRMADGSLPRASILGDVKNVRGELGICDIICGGFPCQDISVAGNGKGLAGERSGLFYEIIRLTKEIRPTFVFLENVPAIRTRGLREVIRAFAEIGYDCRWTCISAASVGANHKRERWFLLANSNNARRLRSGQAQPEKRNCAIESVGASENVANPMRERLERHRQQGEEFRKKKTELGLHSNGSHAVSAEWWATEPNMGRVVNGTSFRVDRIKALGNGVVPLQVRTAFFKLLGIEEYL